MGSLRFRALTRQVLLSNDPPGVRLADFGMAARDGQWASHDTVAGSPFYMAPEMLCEAGYGCAVDVWAVGCTALALCVPSEKRKAAGLARIVAMMSAAQREKAFAAVAACGYSDDVSEFVRLCLTEDAAKRPSAASLLRLRLFRGVGDEELEEDVTELVM